MVQKGKAAEVFCSTFTGSWFMILAITSDGDYYAFVLSGRNSTIIETISWNFWILLDDKKIDHNRKITVMQNNCQIHHSNKMKELINKSRFMFVFIPAYTPEYASVEKVCGIIKANLRKIRACKSINKNKGKRKHVIKILMESVPKPQLISVLLNFITNL